MLDLIRRKQKSLLVKVVFWTIIAAFIGTIFLVWGKGSESIQTGVAAKINGTRITFEEVRSAYENLRRLYQNVYRDRFNAEMEKQLNLDQQALDGLISQTLLLQEAKRLKIQVSKQEVVDAVAANPAFMRDGQFDRDQYLQVLQHERMKPKDFEEIQRRQMLIQKVREHIEQAATVTPEEVTEEFRQRNEKINLAFVRLAPALFESKVTVNDQLLQDYYKVHQEEFRTSEKAALRFVQFDPMLYAKDLALSDEELQDYYRRHEADFDVPEQVKVSHILFRFDAEADEDLRDKKRKLAEKVLAEVKEKDGKNFADMARRYSDDAGSAVEGGSLGYFTHGTMVSAFEEAAFSLEPGQLSGIVETSFGFHILKGEGHIKAEIKPLASVLPEVKDGLTKEKSRELAMDKAMTAYSQHRETGNLEAVAAEYALTIKETGLFGRDEAIPGIGLAPEANATAFSIKKGELARPVVLPQGIFLLALEKRVESVIPELPEVRAAVEKAFRQEQSVEMARTAAEELLKEIKSGKSLQQLGSREMVKVEETGFFPGSYGSFIPKIGNSPELAEESFSLTKENPVAGDVYPVSGHFIVARLKERLSADMSKLDEATRQDLEKVLLTRKKEALLEGRLADLRKSAAISIDPSLDYSMEKAGE